MPPTATLDDIKAYQRKIEKNQISPDVLPACPRCKVSSSFFKIHAFRERRFLIIVDFFVTAVYCALIRFICPGCKKTFTYYPDFAIPYKHYTRQSIIGYAGAYVETQTATYQQAVITENAVAGYPGSDRTLAPSTVHRWITTLGGFVRTTQKVLDLLLQQNPCSSICRNLALLKIPHQKYKSQRRKNILLNCFKLVVSEKAFLKTFKTSIFTKFAIRCAFR